MAMRSTASFSIGLGLVNFAVKAYKPTEKPNGGISFNQLHGGLATKVNDEGIEVAAPCHSRLNQIMFCSACNTKVDNADIVKGYEYEKGKYVVIPADELKALDAASTKHLVIDRFVDEDEVNVLYFEDGMWYLAPDKGAGETFATFRDGAIGKMAIGTYIVSGHDHMVAIWPQDNALIMRCIIPHAELRDVTAIPGYADIPARGNPKYSKLMDQLVESQTAEFAPQLSVDARAEELKKLVDSHLPDGKAFVPAVVEERATVTDLMAALEKSLEKLAKPKASKVTAIKRTRKKAA